MLNFRDTSEVLAASVDKVQRKIKIKELVLGYG